MIIIRCHIVPQAEDAIDNPLSKPLFANTGGTPELHAPVLKQKVNTHIAILMKFREKNATKYPIGYTILYRLIMMIHIIFNFILWLQSDRQYRVINQQMLYAQRRTEENIILSPEHRAQLIQWVESKDLIDIIFDPSSAQYNDLIIHNVGNPYHMQWLNRYPMLLFVAQVLILISLIVVHTWHEDLHLSVFCTNLSIALCYLLLINLNHCYVKTMLTLPSINSVIAGLIFMGMICIEFGLMFWILYIINTYMPHNKLIGFLGIGLIITLVVVFILFNTWRHVYTYPI